VAYLDLVELYFIWSSVHQSMTYKPVRGKRVWKELQER